MKFKITKKQAKKIVDFANDSTICENDDFYTIDIELKECVKGEKVVEEKA